MRKGQVVGGQANGDTTGKALRGMLPPTGNGPIEVTRETLEGSPENKPLDTDRTAPAPASTVPVNALVSTAVSDMLSVELPETGEPAEVIVACEKRLYAANTLLDAMHTRALESYFHYAGPAIRLAWSTESWRATIDPATGKECRSWSAWLRSVKVSRQHAFRMTKEQPIREALKGLDVGKLGVRQIDALSPVLTSHGKKGVKELWTSAMGWGDTSAAALLKLRKQLGLEPDKVISEGEEPSDDSSENLPLLRFQTRPGLFDAARVREAAKAQPDIALLVAKEIYAALGVDPAEA